MADRRPRAIERTVQRLRRDGLSASEVAWRLRRSPGYVRRIERFSQIERPVGPTSGVETSSGGLRPIERCVLNALQGGASYAEIAARLRRSPGYVSRVERFANLRTEIASS
jgi:DNA-binding CsgD family transcriptional regulator